MPYYEYYCKNCDLRFEVLLKKSAKCKKCLLCKKPARKQVSQSSFSLKGGGWYVDGYQK